MSKNIDIRFSPKNVVIIFFVIGILLFLTNPPFLQDSQMLKIIYAFTFTMLFVLISDAWTSSMSFNPEN